MHEYSTDMKGASIKVLGIEKGNGTILTRSHNKTQLNNNNFKVGSAQSCMSRLVRKPTICIGENKGADQLLGNREADQRLCFRYSDSTVPLLF